MSEVNLYLLERLAALRVEEERRQAEMRRLASEARAGRASWLSQQRGQALHRLGRFFVSLGQRLLRDVVPQTLPREGHADGTA